MKLIILLINTLLIFILTPREDSMYNNISYNDSNFEIIFWGSSILDMDVLQKSTFPQLISKFKPLEILSDKYISKYYWDEQLIEFEHKKLIDDTGHVFISSPTGLFSIVLNQEIIYHGISRLNMGSAKDKYDDSNYPAIINQPHINPQIAILALKPRFYPYTDIFRDYDEEEQKNILNQEVLKYFEKEGKIIRGKIELEKVFGYKHISYQDENRWIVKDGKLYSIEKQNIDK